MRDELDWGRRESLEQQIHDRKRLRRIYNFITEHAPYINIEYEGTFQRIGDTVSIRPKVERFDVTHTNRPLCIDRRLPRVGRFDYILNVINWGVPADLVITCDEKDFYMGYKEL